MDSLAIVGDAHRQASTPRRRKAMEGGAHRQASSSRRSGGCWPPPHRAEPHTDSPATVGGVRRQTSHACRSPPHRAEPLPDSPATEGGAHRQASSPERRGGVSRRHTTRSRYRTRPRGGRRAPTPPTRCHPRSCHGRRHHSAQTALCPPKIWQRRPSTAREQHRGEGATDTLPCRRQAHGQTA
jgi:hypothetical protein